MKNNFIHPKIYNNLHMLKSSPIIYNQDTIHKEHKDPIYVVTQFYIPSEEKRYREIQYCLQKNVENPLVECIYLINERTYTPKEMGLDETTAKRVKQIVNQGERMTYKHAFSLVEQEKLKGYIIISNSDIFFDETLASLYNTNLSYSASFYTQLRHEFNGTQELSTCSLFGPRSDSQDVWIYHTNFQPSSKMKEMFHFQLGKAGCDNSFIYRVILNGYLVYNEPIKIKCYHYHTTPYRTYTIHDRIRPPYIRVYPKLKE